MLLALGKLPSPPRCWLRCRHYMLPSYPLLNVLQYLSCALYLLAYLPFPLLNSELLNGAFMLESQSLAYALAHCRDSNFYWKYKSRKTQEAVCVSGGIKQESAKQQEKPRASEVPRALECARLDKRVIKQRKLARTRKCTEIRRQWAQASYKHLGGDFSKKIRSCGKILPD